jgi:hypothetical protein
MHRSSDTIATIAAGGADQSGEIPCCHRPVALPARGGSHLSLRPLSSGLDVIRKTLGRHEIATIQATDIDSQAGLLRLTTVLAHSSGEWICSDWPVCHISDIASVQRVGAALTYARRYALFALVGIAGEDDLDAPDLGAGPNAGVGASPDHRKQSNGQAAAAQPVAPGDRKLSAPSARSVLGEQLSASLRESLIAQLAAINSPEEAAAWAHRNMPAKNTLMAADAKIVEEGFRARLSVINDLQPSEATSEEPAPGGRRPSCWAPDACHSQPKRGAYQRDDSRDQRESFQRGSERSCGPGGHPRLGQSGPATR